MLVAKKIFIERFTVDKKGNENWISLATLIRLMEDCKAIDTEYNFKSYTELLKLKRISHLIQEHFTLFRGRPYLTIRNSILDESFIRYYPNDIINERIRIRFENYSPTLAWLIKNCPAEKSIQYIKERKMDIEIEENNDTINKLISQLSKEG